MNVSQVARSQNMMANFLSRHSEYASQVRMPSLGFDANNVKSGNQVDADSLLRKMGVDGLNGRTVREMAKSQEALRQQSAASQASGAEAATKAQSIRSQYTPISDEATEAMQKLAMQDALNSVEKGSAPSAKEREALINEHLKSVDPSKRAAAYNTMNKVWESELDRIGKHIKEKDSSWNNWGDKFDTDVLKDYKPGVNVWV